MNHTPSNALIGRNGFAALVFSQFLGAFNDNLYKMIVSLLALGAAINVGGAGAYLSAAGIVFILPYLLFSGYAGFVADAFGKRTVLVVTKVIEIGVMALALAALVVGRIELLFATLFLMAVQSTFFSPAKYGILPEILPAALLPRANGALEMSRYVAVILGTVAGGALLAHFSNRPVYMGAVLIAVACVGAIASLRIDPVPRSGSRKRFRVNPWSEIVAGVRRLTKDSRLGLAVAGITYFEFLGSFVLLDVLLIGKELMALDDVRTSLLGASAGIGIGIGAFAAGRLSRNRIELGLVPIGAVGVSVVLIAASYATSTYSQMVMAVALIGFFGGLFFVPLNALLQHLAGVDEKGHLIATNNFLNMLGVLVSCLALWLLRDLCDIAPDRILMLAGALALCAAACILLFLPEWREAANTWIRETCGIRSSNREFERGVKRRHIFALTVVVLVAGMAGTPSLAQAAEPTPGVYRYNVRHTIFGGIGTHTIQVARKGRNFVVTMDARIEVKLMFMTVLRLHTWGREVWTDGRLVAFDSRSDEDGDLTTVSVRANSGGLVMEGPRGQSNVTGPVAVTNPWSRSILSAPVLIEPTSGRLLSVGTRSAGEQFIEALGRTVKAQKHVVSGDMEAELWFTDDGTWLRMEFSKAGGRVTISLDSVTYTQTPRIGAIAAAYR